MLISDFLNAKKKTVNTGPYKKLVMRITIVELYFECIHNFFLLFTDDNLNTVVGL